MEGIILILLSAGYIIYRLAYEVPKNIRKDIRRTEEKIDMLRLHLQEMELMINEVNKKLDNK